MYGDAEEEKNEDEEEEDEDEDGDMRQFLATLTFQSPGCPSSLSKLPRKSLPQGEHQPLFCIVAGTKDDNTWTCLAVC